MTLVDQWRAIQATLPEDWQTVRLRLIVTDRGRTERAAALLGPTNAGRRGSFVMFSAARRGGGSSPELVRRLLTRIDSEKIHGTLDAVGVEEAPSQAAGASSRRSLAAQWDQLAAELPADWSDVYGEIELASTDHLERGALLLAPVNPARVDERPAYRFRAARRFGYGVSSQMARRCFERLDAESIRGELRVLYALSDTRPVYTQGPVWYAGGRAV